jgi:hypothetical protein
MKEKKAARGLIEFMAGDAVSSNQNLWPVNLF